MPEPCPTYTAKDVATLRQMTGAGMLDCRNALEEADGDFEKAAQILRLKGLSGAAKRSDREASEGAVAAVRSGDAGAVVALAARPTSSPSPTSSSH